MQLNNLMQLYLYQVILAIIGLFTYDNRGGYVNK